MQLLQYVFGVDRRRQMFLMLLVTTSVVLSFAGIALEGLIIDRAIEPGDLEVLWRLSAVYLVLFLAAYVLDYWVHILFTDVTQRLLTRMRTDLFRHVLRMGPGFFHQNSVGEVMSRIIPEVEQLGNFLSKIILVPLSCGLTIVAGFSLVAEADWRLGLASALIFSVVFVFLPGLRKRLEGLSRRSPRLLRAISRRTEDTLSHYHEIHNNQTFAFEESRFEDGLQEFVDVQLDTARVYGKTSFLTRSLSQLATLSVYALGGWLVIRETGMPQGMTVGSIFVAVRALSTVMSPIGTLIDYSQRFRENSIKFEMVTDYLRLPAEMVDGPEAKTLAIEEGSIRLESVSFGFEPEHPILKNINLNIAPGEWVALVGPAGSGKSTVNLLINRMARPTEGDVRLQGLSLQQIQLASLRAGVGYLAQAKTNAPVLFGGTLLDNLLYGLQRRPEPVPGVTSGWLDLHGAGYASEQELYEHLVELLHEIGFYDDVLHFGLTTVTLRDALECPNLFPVDEDAEGIRRELLAGRQRFLEKIEGPMADLVEFFQPDRFMENCSLLENLVFTSPAPFLRDARQWQQLMEVLGTVLDDTHLRAVVMTIGKRTALAVAGLPPRTLQSQLGLSLGVAGEPFDDLAEKIRAGSELSPSERNRLLRLGLEYNPSRAVDQYLEESDREWILLGRRAFAEILPQDLQDRLVFYDPERYVDAATVRDNLIMGKVNLMIHRGEERVNALVREVIDEASLEDEIVRLGLMMDVGERGARLSGGQGQKAALVRVLLKRPHVLILDEATSALDNTSQQKVQRLLAARFRGKTVVEVAHRLDQIKEHDRIVVLKSGQVAEIGSFDTLMAKKGLFYELWEAR